MEKENEKMPCGISESGQEFLKCLHTQWTGKKTFFYESLSSTNERAKQLAAEGTAVHGALVLAQEQSAGKGRQGRSWESPAGTNIYMTLVLKPRMAPEHICGVTLVAALAVRQAIQKRYCIDCRIKWPNDLVVHGRKLCGILTEMSTGKDGTGYVVVGIGINANTAGFSGPLQRTASSLLLELGEPVDRMELAAGVCSCFEPLYEQFEQAESLSFMKEEYNEALVNRKERVRVLEPGNEWEGEAIGINEDGELLVRKEDGRIRAVISGEVSVRGVYGYV